MPPRIVIVVRGGVVQEVASDTTDVLIKLLDLDSIEEGDAPDQWRPPDVVIGDPHVLDGYPREGVRMEHTKEEKRCPLCHGALEEGKAMAFFPMLSGEEYVCNACKCFTTTL